MSSTPPAREETSSEKPSTPEAEEGGEDRGFSWVTVDNLTVPCLVRDGSKFVAVRMMESKLLAKYPRQSEQELHNMPPLASFYMTKHEASLLTTVNTEECAKQFGEEDFTNADLVVKLIDFQEFYSAVKKLFSGKLSQRGGWCQINNTLIPFVIRSDGEKFVPLNVVRYAAGLLNNTKVVYVYPTEEECFLLNEKCKSATMNFVFTISTKLVSLDKVREVCPSVKMVDNLKTAFPSTPAFPTQEPIHPENIFGHKSPPMFPFPDMMHWNTHEFASGFKDFSPPWGGPAPSPMYSDSLSTPRAALMLERMAAWSKLQEEIHFTNFQNSQNNSDGNPTATTAAPGAPSRTPPSSISNIDQQSILQKIGVNVNIHLNGKFDGQDNDQIKNKRKGHTPLRYSPTSEALENDRLYEPSVHPAITRSPTLTSTTGSPLSGEGSTTIGRQPPPMFNFRPGSTHRPSFFGQGLSPHSSGTGSIPGTPGSGPAFPNSPLQASGLSPFQASSLSPFGHLSPHMIQQQLPGLPMWKYDYFKVRKIGD